MKQEIAAKYGCLPGEVKQRLGPKWWYRETYMRKAEHIRGIYHRLEAVDNDYTQLSPQDLETWSKRDEGW